MKKVFDNEYPNDQINEISKWLEKEMYKEDDGELKPGMYSAKIIVEIIPN